MAVLDEIQLLLDEQRGNAWTNALLGISTNHLHLCGANEPISLDTWPWFMGLPREDGTAENDTNLITIFIIEIISDIKKIKTEVGM